MSYDGISLLSLSLLFFCLLGEIEMCMIGGLLCYKSLWKRFSHIDWTYFSFRVETEMTIDW